MGFPRFGPDAKNAAGTQCPPASLDGLPSIEGISLGIRSRVWPLEQVEHDRVVGLPGLYRVVDAIRDIPHMERNTRVIKARAGKRRERPATPIRNNRVELRHANLARD